MKRNSSELNRSKYKAISNLVRSKTRQDTVDYISALSVSYSANAKKFWNFVNSVKGFHQSPPPLSISGNHVSDDVEKATAFNQYFNSVFTTENCSGLQSLRESVKFNGKLIDSVQFTPENVYEELKSLQRDKACGPDNLPSQLLQVAADFISLPLSHLFQLSLSSGALPRDWVTANVVPVHKKGDKHLPSNYRPISLTSIVVKVMERIIHRQLVLALESKHLISDSQHGFRCKRSTVTLLLSAINDWAFCLERRNSVHCVLLDLAKAFDSVPHCHLLLKLECFGIHGNLLSWFGSFLANRYQRVVINGCFSEWLPVRSGVPQGSVLGPLLFLLYIDEIHHVISNSTVKLFADDIALYKQIVSTHDETLLQEDLTKVYQWSQLWQLKLNAQKCESICISYKRSPPMCKYHLNDQPIPSKSVVRYLGMYINSHLKWSDQSRL